MRNLLNATLMFGPIMVPVGVSTAAKRIPVEFRTLHDECGTPIKQQNRCEECDKSLSSDDVTKGYEIAKGQFVKVNEDELALFLTPKSAVIELPKFVDRREIHPVMVEKSYFLTPHKAKPLQVPYVNLAATMSDLGVVGVGKATLWKKEYPIVVRPDGPLLLLSMLFHADELVSAADIVTALHAEPSDGDREVTAMVLQKDTGVLEADDLHNGPRERTLQYIEAKFQKQEIVMPEKQAEPTIVPMDYVALMREYEETK